MKMVDDIDAGSEKYLTSWRNSDDPSPGDYVFKIENQGLPEMVIYKGEMKTFRTGTWNGLTFTGTLPISIFKPELIFREERLISVSEPYNSSIISRLRMETSGIQQRYTMNARRDNWNHVFSSPVDSCDQYGHCGPNGICRIDKPLRCECLKGFAPKSQNGWDAQDWSSGCARIRPLNCESGDGFLEVKRVKYPNMLEFWLNTSMSLNECQVKCLRNCNCTAYANPYVDNGGRGCLMWFGDLIDIREHPPTDIKQNIYIRLPASELDPNTDLEKEEEMDKKWPRKLILISAGSGILVSALVNGAILLMTKRMRPEYAIDGKYSVKSDIFSLGVVLLEIVSGKKNRAFDHCDNYYSLLGHAWLLWKENRILELMDECLNDTFIESEVKRCIQVGLLCVQKFAEDRQVMSSVIFMLGTDGAILPKPKEPGFFTERSCSTSCMFLEMEHFQFSILCTLVLCTSLVQFSVGVDTLLANQTLVIGQTLISQSQIFELGFFSPGKSKNWFLGIWYKSTPGVCVWVANRNNPITHSEAVFLAISNYGALLISTPGSIIWSANSSGVASNPTLQLLDTGNLVLLEDSSESDYIWQSFDHPTDTWLRGMKMVDAIDAGSEKYLTSWRNSDDPSPGDYVFRIENQGLPEMVIYKGTTKTFRTGKWNGLYFSGILPFPNHIFKPKLVFREERLISISEVYDNSIISRITLETSGTCVRYAMNARRDSWNHVYASPVDLCDQYDQCGPNGICRIDKPVRCECLKGFAPSLRKEWDAQDWSGGCTRIRPLNCHSGDYGFLEIRRVKYPDMLEFWLNTSMSLGECRDECLRNCNCTAFANPYINNGGRGCLIWFGELIDIREHPPALNKQNIYIRLPASELGVSVLVDPSADLEKEEKNKKWPRKLIVISAGSGILVSALVNGSILLLRRQKWPAPDRNNEDLELPLFKFVTIVAATNNFSEENIVGEGGFGLVYKVTHGYMAPEYAIDGKFSAKSDIFSLGVVLLEIVSGKRNRAFDHSGHYYSLLGHAWLLWKENRVMELMDESLNDTFIESEVKRCIQVGLLCVQKFAEDRPVMSSVIFMLGTEGAILPEPKEPGFFTERSCSAVRNCTLQSKMSHKATMSITDLEAR
ncbi:g-type lectin s-receptor-like serine/threonine-protein kinase at4g27290 [Phtheirospermum japonicum]|uniref:non-specific serine/threonine protein kinase n=1 Tax=Phtheirospermum japonicum TaxID=374723 RepID=A0A830BT30_9LAMI|nr:g-type lectin s-receptor-like serine/threonine-protein kinase at4g27290 [Phtheirospermum japonicum]